MKEKLLTEKEFLDKHGPFRFEVKPLDVSLAKIQYELLCKFKTALDEGPSTNDISASYESKSPRLEISTVTIECIPDKKGFSHFALWLTVCDRLHDRYGEKKLFAGDSGQMGAFVDSPSFVPSCKGYVLYMDYEFSHYASFQDYAQQLIYRVIEQTEKLVPEYGDFMPVLELMRNPDCKGTKHLVGKYGLQVFKMPEDIVPDPAKRYLKAAAYDPTGTWNSNMVIGSGTKEEILAIMRAEGFAEELSYTFGDLTDNLREM